MESKDIKFCVKMKVIIIMVLRVLRILIICGYYKEYCKDDFFLVFCNTYEVSYSWIKYYYFIDVNESS